VVKKGKIEEISDDDDDDHDNDLCVTYLRQGSYVFISVSLFVDMSVSRSMQQKAQLMLTNPRNAFSGQSRSPCMVQFNMSGMVSY